MHSVRHGKSPTAVATLVVEHTPNVSHIRVSDERPLLNGAATRAANERSVKLYTTKDMFRPHDEQSTGRSIPVFAEQVTHNRSNGLLHHHQGNNRDLTADHQQIQAGSRIRDIPIQFVSNCSTRSTAAMFNQPADVTRPIVERKHSNSEQHYDFPADAVEQLKKHQRVENDPADEPTVARAAPPIVPSNVLKRMDHLNTVFIKPTKIEPSLPQLVFQENESHVDPIAEEQQPACPANEEPDHQSRSSSPLFYEKPGIPPLDEEEPVASGARRVKFSNAPIRVYPTYSPGEYDRRNEDIDPFSASAEYELEKRIENMNVFNVEIEKGSEGLGMSVLGMGVGADGGLEKLGIFVKVLNPQGVIAKDGRIQVGDQIIEVNDHSLVGVTHAYASNVLKSTAGFIKFVVGREKDPQNSEVLRLIQRSIQLDQQQQEENSQDVSEQEGDDPQPPSKQTSKNEIMAEKRKTEYEMSILKQCFESLEKTLENAENEKDFYQQLYQQTLKDFQQMEEKLFQATDLLKELQDRETQISQEQTQINMQQKQRIDELTKKIEDLEKVLSSSVSQMKENPPPNASVTSVPERPPVRPRPPEEEVLFASARNVSVAPPLPVTSTRSRAAHQNPEPCQIRSISETNKSSRKLDLDIDRNTFINKPQVIKMSSRSVLSRYLFKPPSNESSNQFNRTVDMINDITSMPKVPSLDQPGTATRQDPLVSDEYLEVRDWTLDHCIQWLTRQEMTIFIPVFLSRNINGEKLLSLDSTKMKAMGIKSSRDRDRLKTNLKQLKHADLDQIRERLLAQQSSVGRRSNPDKNRSRSSSMTKLKDRKLFSSLSGK